MLKKHQVKIVKGAVILTTLCVCVCAADVRGNIDFGRDIQPLLREHCVECHGPSQQMKGLRLDRRRDALPNRVGANGARIVPGNSAKSLLFQRLTGTQSGPQMPPAGPLPESKINLIQTWIDQGAVWPDALSGDRSPTMPERAVEKMRAALREGAQARFQSFVKANSTSLNARGQDGWTPLMFAALYGSVESVKLLLDRGALVNAQNDSGGTALMYAVDDTEKTKLLLEHGADPNLRSGEGRTALMIAVANAQSFPVVKLLLEKGADAKMSLPDGRGTLALALNSSDPRLASLLLEQGAKGPLPLSSALRMGCEGCFDVMLERAQASDLKGALRGATVIGNLRMVDMLLARGAQAPSDDTSSGNALSDSPSSRNRSSVSEPWCRSKP
jgi:hypothetical protein